MKDKVDKVKDTLTATTEELYEEYSRIRNSAAVKGKPGLAGILERGKSILFFICSPFYHFICKHLCGRSYILYHC